MSTFISVEELHEIAHSKNIFKIRLAGYKTIENQIYDEWIIKFKNKDNEVYLVKR